MNKLHEIIAAHPDASGYARGYLDYIAVILRNLDPGPIAEWVDLVEAKRLSGHTIFFIGNGGSAAIAAHMVNDIAIGTRTGDRRPYRAVSLTDQISVMTALANDMGYDTIFVEQLKVHLREGDALVAISVSGNSPNIIAAVDYAHSRGAVVVGMTGFDGGKLKQLADICIHVDCARGEYGPVEDVFSVLGHLVGTFLVQRQDHCS